MRITHFAFLLLLFGCTTATLTRSDESRRQLQDDDPTDSPVGEDPDDELDIFPEPGDGDENSTIPLDATDPNDEPSEESEVPSAAPIEGDIESSLIPTSESSGSMQPTVAGSGTTTGETGESLPSSSPTGEEGSSAPTDIPPASEDITEEPTNAPTFVEEPAYPTPTYPGYPTPGGKPPTTPGGKPNFIGPPTDEPTEEYVPLDDDPFTDVDEEKDWSKEAYETIEEMEKDRNVLIALGVVFGFGLVLVIITAQQMLENPDGICASLCRISVACFCGITRCVCFPCRMICGCTNKDRRSHDLIMQEHSNNYTHDLELS